MSHFYGILENTINQNKTLRGHKTTGIECSCASWKGSIRVVLWHDEENNQDCFQVSQQKWHGVGKEKIIKQGVIGK